MTPTPQENASVQQETVGTEIDGERIVITGMSGLYPQSENINQLSEILYNKKSPVTWGNLRWKFNHPEVAKYAGNVPELERFDAQFFKVHHRLGNCMDPMCRKLLEQAYSAIYDAGINPEHLSGKKIGVFIGSCFSESDKSYFYDVTSRSGFGITGCCRAMYANRISYWLNAKGPSLAIDEACCSSAAALEQAYLTINRGECEAAIVGASCLCLHPQSSVHYGRLLKQSTDGKTRSFDVNGEGPVKSEAINVLFLQKAKDAVRIYGDLVHAKTEYVGLLKGDTGPTFGFLKEHDLNVNFLKKFYEEAKVQPQAVEYVEAFGAAIPEVDKAELEAIDQVFCHGKQDALLVGSVMSNIGYVEAATTIAGVTKVLLGYHNGMLAGNIDCDNVRKDVEALRDGRIKILTDHEPCPQAYAAVNGTSLTGLNSHILLKSHYKPKDLSRYKCSFPRLITLSARQHITVNKMIDSLKSRPIDPEELALLHNIHQSGITGHLGRGFAILDTNENNQTISLTERAEYFDDVRRPLWFVYSGMGSQWAGMGTQLMRIPIFAAAIERCHRALEPKGIDIVHIITSTDEHIFDNILHSFVGIAAIQIGLTDILQALGLVADGIIGHSVGELGCAYADGCLTAEEMILTAYSRGLVSLQTPFIRGSMAAVGLGYETISTMIPPEIEVACHNGPDSSTLSGPVDVMQEFVAELTAKGFFAKEVPSSNIAYHSRYIAEAGPFLLNYLKQVIKTPKARSDRWVSTSVPKERWNEPLCQYSSAEYHTNNLLCPVLFEETLSEIPNSAVLVEIAPHGLLQAILKRSLHVECKNIALTRRNHPDNTFLLLEAIGKLYMEGYHPKVQNLYPKINMPVSTGTPFLSHHVEWAHGEKWAMPLYKSAIRRTAAASSFIVSLHDLENQYLSGHVIEDKIRYPYAAALVAVWDTFAMILAVPKKELSVEFHNIKLNKQPVLYDQSQMNFSISIQKGSGYFEILDKNTIIGSGSIDALKVKKLDVKKDKTTPMVYSDNDLSASDIYDLFLERQYSYSGEFCSLKRVNTILNEAEILWRNNWVTFIDGLIQLNVLRQTHNSISKPTQIKRISIDVDKHRQTIDEGDGGNVLLKAEMNELLDYTSCGGVLIESISYKNLPAIAARNIDLASMQFVKNGQTNIDTMTSVLILLQIIAENLNKNTLTIIGVTDRITEGSIFSVMNKIGSNIFGINIRYIEVPLNTLKNSELYRTADGLIINNLSRSDRVCQLLSRLLRQNMLVINEENRVPDNYIRSSNLYRVLFTLSSEAKALSHIQLVRWQPAPLVPITTAITIHSSTDYALLNSACSSIPPKHRIVVFSPHPAPAGLKDMLRAWRKQSDCNLIQLVMVKNENNNVCIDELPEIDLAFNVVNECNWGGEYYLPIEYNMTQNVMLKTLQVGDYDSLVWTEAPEITKDELMINVHYAAICNVDLKKANGTITLEKEFSNCFGMDYSGTTASGKRVMGIIPEGALASQIRPQPELIWPVPDHWSLEEAASVPFPYIVALYCLGVQSTVLPSKAVLIHGGCGAIGQAAIAIALAVGYRVYTTVSDITKKKFLLKLFPELKENHIGNSRDDSFADMILHDTKGAGCKLALNTVNLKLRAMTYKCVSETGITIDLQYINGEEKFLFGMHNLTKERGIMRVNVCSIFKKENQHQFKVLQSILSEAIARGYVRPLTYVSYAPTDVIHGFKLLGGSQHRGRVLIRMKDNIPPVPNNRVTFEADFCHLILSDKESSSSKLANKLIDCGARAIHINCNNYSSAKLQYRIRSWQKSGIQVQVSSYDINTDSNIANILSKAKQLGSLQGIYSIVDAEQNIQESLFCALDLTSRKLCPDLRYFVVINVGENIIGQDTCISRAINKLPATLLTLPDLKSKSNAIWRGAFENALRVSKTTIFARVTPEEQLSLLTQITAIGGITLTKDTPMTATLEELGILPENLETISLFLQVKYHTDYNVAQMTFDDIIHLDEPNDTFKELKGLGTFFGQIDPDELVASTEMVFMPTITSGSYMRDNEFDMTQKFLCIIPGMEGLRDRFSVICKRLKLSALVLQPSLDNPNESILDMAKRFAELLLKSAAVKEDFYLLGYESGIFVALEIAKILEEHGLYGTVFCIGYAPDELKKVINKTLSQYKNEEELQNAIVHHMCSLMTNEDTTQLNESLLNAASWPQKLRICLQFLKGYLPYSTQYAISLVDRALWRIKQVQQYNIANITLRSRLILMRAAPDHTSTTDTTLQKYSQQSVIVHQLRATFGQCSKDARCAALINQYLDPNILEEFEKKNICDAYLLSPNSFMTVHHDY